jgi:hypothetical protein
MKTFKHLSSVLLVCVGILFFSNKSYAVIPFYKPVVKAQVPAAKPEMAAAPMQLHNAGITTLASNAPVTKHKMTGIEKWQLAKQLIRQKLMPRRYSDNDNAKGVMSIVSFVLGLAGVAMWVIGAINLIALASSATGTITAAYAGLFLVAFGCGIAALILSILGHKSKRGFAIAGMILGIFDIIIGGLAGFIILAVVG